MSEAGAQAAGPDAEWLLDAERLLDAGRVRAYRGPSLVLFPGITGLELTRGLLSRAAESARAARPGRHNGGRR